ncbi:MAG: transposase [Azonexus sp.]|nr:transposase [Azonexus sp.]MCK6413148.1 transposase [Azonexus sp.]
MTKPRSTLISLADTPWYHVVNRCVRRAFLCGDDAHTGKNHDHRRGWIVDRVKQLAGVFAIDVAAYAVMSNHYHLVLRVDAERAQGWSNEEVLRRWTQLFDGPMLVQRLLSGQGGEMDQATLNAIDEWTTTYRARLSDISWFMRILNETVARQANAEDEVTGHFWEGRFKSQALLDEQAILTAMAYVDLNPIRAKMAETPEESEHTSVAERMAELKPEAEPAHQAKIPHDPTTATNEAPAVTASVANEKSTKVTSILTLRQETHLAALPLQPLLTFDGTCRLRAAIPFAFEDYLDLVETTGRSLHPGKRGLITERVPKLLQRLAIDPERFIDCATDLMKQFGSAVGAPAHLTELCAVRQVKYLRGIRAARQAFERNAA